MADGVERVIEEHARACPTHHGPDAFFHIGPVAVDGALAAGGLVLAEAAAGKTRVGIHKQLAALGAERGVALFLAAIEADHLFYYGLLFFYALVVHVGLSRGLFGFEICAANILKTGDKPGLGGLIMRNEEAGMRNWASPFDCETIPGS